MRNVYSLPRSIFISEGTLPDQPPPSDPSEPRGALLGRLAETYTPCPVQPPMSLQLHPGLASRTSSRDLGRGHPITGAGVVG